MSPSWSVTTSGSIGDRNSSDSTQGTGYAGGGSGMGSRAEEEVDRRRVDVGWNFSVWSIRVQGSDATERMHSCERMSG